jgi:hypothetical protein
MGNIARVKGSVVITSLLLAITAAFAGTGSAVAADKAEETKKACLARHEQAQVLRRNNRLTEARTALLACAQDSCPGGVRADCVEWLGTVNNAIPSVVVTAKVRDKDESNVRLVIDDEVASTHLDGIAIELNPGNHAFRLEVVGQEPVEQQVLLVEGQKNRVVAVRFGRGEPETSVSARPVDLYRPVPTLDYVLAGVAIAGVGSFAAFGAWGMSDRSSLQNSCAPVCAPSQLSSVRSKFLVADISLGAAVLATVAGAFVFFTRPGYERPVVGGRSSSSARAELMVVPTRSGAFLGVEGAL